MKINSFTKGLSILAVSLSLFACNEKKLEESPSQTVIQPVEVIETIPAEKQTLHFVGPHDLTVTLTTENNWNTAKLTDNSDKIYDLKIEPAADGVYLANDDGVSIHMKNGEALLELVKGKPINLKEVSNN